MNLLAFDTATERMSVALDARGEVFSFEAAGGAQASATLVPAILALLERGGVALRDLDAIAFGRGPGAFTGLRTACSVAQGLAFGAGKPVLPIDTLLAVAEDARAGGTADLRVWAVMDARMDEVYAAHYEFAAGCWSVLDAPRLATPEWLSQRWQGQRWQSGRSPSQPPQVVAGTALAAFGDRLTTFDAQRVPGALPRPRALLALARALWAQGGAVDAALALPLYLRDKVAQTSAERESARAVKDALEASR